MKLNDLKITLNKSRTRWTETISPTSCFASREYSDSFTVSINLLLKDTLWYNNMCKKFDFSKCDPEHRLCGENTRTQEKGFDTKHKAVIEVFMPKCTVN